MDGHNVRMLTRPLAGLLFVALAASGAWAQQAAPPPQTATSRPQQGPPGAQAIQQALAEAHERFKDVKEGKNADYIPVLAEVPSDLFGIVVVTADGRMYDIGDTERAFSIQSISKVFTLAHVLDQAGAAKVVDTIGVDATGQKFNSIVAIEQYQGAEMNPLVNAGAIATTSLVQGDTPAQIWERIIGVHGAFAGRPLTVDEEVYRSEAATNQRNRAIAMLMSAYERLQGDPLQATDLYTRQCSISVNARDLAAMAATLANGGRNPLNGEQVVRSEVVEQVLAVMATAGLYDDSGKWLFKTGLPAKSGVGGGIIAVSPGRFGIAAFSPPLDDAGNSVRAQRAIAYIADALQASPYEVVPMGAGTSRPTGQEPQ